jgi:hypothetical protein
MRARDTSPFLLLYTAGAQVRKEDVLSRSTRGRSARRSTRPARSSSSRTPSWARPKGRGAQPPARRGALVAYGKNREFRVQQQLLTGSAREARQLSDQRYKGGTASYLEVLDSDTRYFAAELGLAQAQLDELLALVQLYRALGGGWQ